MRDKSGIQSQICRYTPLRLSRRNGTMMANSGFDPRFVEMGD